MKTLAQGEIFIRKIETMPEGLHEHKEVNQSGQAIISHSESGNHHVLERPVKVYKGPAPKRKGLDIFYAMLDEPNSLIQDATVPHGKHDFEAGDIIEFRISREFDPFTQQARRVAD